MKRNFTKLENLIKRSYDAERTFNIELNNWNTYIASEGKIATTYNFNEWNTYYCKLLGIGVALGYGEDDISEYINTVYPKKKGIERL